jgi:hypothetical protein
MSDFKSRLNEEKSELKEKLEKLNGFIQTENFEKVDDVQKALLKIQAQAMATYLTCLEERIVRL